MSEEAYNVSMFVKEFDQWAHREGAHRGEDFVIRNYLSKDGRTLEAGCGGGRLLLDMQARGFRDLHGFDYLPAMIEVARHRDTSGTIDYRVQNAVSLDYADNSFDQLLYMQQVLCFLSSVEDQRRAIDEAFRVLRPGGTVVACVLADRSRRKLLPHRLMIMYHGLLRKLTLRKVSPQFSPWLRSNKKVNPGAFADRGPYMYWFREDELESLFQNAGFEIVAIGTDAQVGGKGFVASASELRQAPFSGGIYLVGRKPGG